MHQINEQCFRYFAEIIRTLKSTNQHEKVLSLVVDRIVRQFHCQTCAVVLIDPKTEYLRIDNCHNLSLTFCNSFRRRIATATIGQLLWTGKPVVIPDSSVQPDIAREVEMEHHFGSCVAVQIAVDQRTLGYLHVDSADPGAVGEQDLDVLQMFADIAGLAVNKSRQFEENLRLDRVDHETGVEKYVPFLEKMRMEMDRAEEFSENFAFLLLDVDNFKDTVNTYGFEASRQLLRELGDILKSTVRPVDTVARFGFDEFIVHLSNTGLERAIETANVIRTAIAERVFTPRSLHTSVSIGVAAFPRNGNSIDTLVMTAKRALYEAQRAGRNQVHSFKSEWFARSKESEPAPH
jgi:diguanylate cyclase (GGDEF)-like protein